MSLQVDQATCDTCGPLSIGVGWKSYGKELARLRRHAVDRRHDVHVLISDSRHYYGSSAANV